MSPRCFRRHADEVSGIEQIPPSLRSNMSGEGGQRWCRMDMAMLPPLPGGDWSEGECAHIDRLRTACKNTEHWELESSRTDAGDPWCIIYDRHQQPDCLALCSHRSTVCDRVAATQAIGE